MTNTTTQSKRPPSDSTDRDQIPMFSEAGDRVAWTPAAPTDTSLEAAASVAKGGRAATYRARVLDSLRQSPKTDEEIGLALGMGQNTVRPRRRELQTDGVVRDSGERRPTTTGRKAIVWEVVDA